MEYLQYYQKYKSLILFCFVLNLVISGIPSIPKLRTNRVLNWGGFKPCYKWNTFNTYNNMSCFIEGYDQVLNLVISGIPSIPNKEIM